MHVIPIYTSVPIPYTVSSSTNQKRKLASRVFSVLLNFNPQIEYFPGQKLDLPLQGKA
jgi:hypothetical protein